MNLKNTLKEIRYEIEWGNPFLEELFNAKTSSFTQDIIKDIKDNLNEITIVQACKHLKIDYRLAINEYCGEEVYK